MPDHSEKAVEAVKRAFYGDPFDEEFVGDVVEIAIEAARPHIEAEVRERMRPLDEWLAREIAALKAMADDRLAKKEVVFHARAQQHAYQAVRERLDHALPVEVERCVRCGHDRNEHGNGIVNYACQSCGCAKYQGRG
jgi:hypothetical protein